MSLLLRTKSVQQHKRHHAACVSHSSLPVDCTPGTSPTLTTARATSCGRCCNRQFIPAFAFVRSRQVPNCSNRYIHIVPVYRDRCAWFLAPSASTGWAPPSYSPSHPHCRNSIGSYCCPYYTGLRALSGLIRIWYIIVEDTIRYDHNTPLIRLAAARLIQTHHEHHKPAACKVATEYHTLLPICSHEIEYVTIDTRSYAVPQAVGEEWTG